MMPLMKSSMIRYEKLVIVSLNLNDKIFHRIRSINEAARKVVIYLTLDPTLFLITYSVIKM